MQEEERELLLPEYLPIEPFFEFLGERTMIDVHSILGVSYPTMKRQKKLGRLTITQADEYAIRLGVHPVNIWGAVWFTEVEQKPNN